MPEHTVTDFREENKRGHRSTTINSYDYGDKGKNRRRTLSPGPLPKVGNSAAKKCCTFCHPERYMRMRRKEEIKQEIIDEKLF